MSILNFVCLLRATIILMLYLVSSFVQLEFTSLGLVDFDRIETMCIMFDINVGYWTGLNVSEKLLAVGELSLGSSQWF